MKKIIFIFIALLSIKSMNAQKKIYSTKTGNAWFDAGTGMEDITGTNKSVLSAMDASTGDMQFSVLIKGFEFWSALLMEHFNENYMESEKYPKSTFKGKIMDMDKVNISKDGTYPVTVKGTLEIHGVKREVETKGTLKVKGETIAASSEFIVVMDDYKIAIPSVVKDKLSKTAKIKINCNYTLSK